MQNKIDSSKCAELPFAVTGPLKRILPGSIWDMSA